MPSFDREDERNGDRAFRLVQNTFVSKFWSNEVLGDMLVWLTQRGYDTVEIDAGPSRDCRALLDEFARALNFPDYFGRNLDALADCLSDVVRGDYGFDPRATGSVLVLRHFDTFARRDVTAAHSVVDIIACQCRNAAVIGHRMMCLIQANDPTFELPPVGAANLSWNYREWQDSWRGV